MSSVGFNTANQLSSQLSALDSSMYSAISLLSLSTLSQSALLAMQTQIQQWSTAISLIASLNKEIGDTLKGIVQKF